MSNFVTKIIFITINRLFRGFYTSLFPINAKLQTKLSHLFIHCFLNKIKEQISNSIFFSLPHYISNPELATQQNEPEPEPDIIEEKNRNKFLVIKLYNALNSRDVETVHRLLTTDLEWWFHGPPHHQHMMRLLTGTSPDDLFIFITRSICVLGSVVLVEGTDITGLAYWVHVWTVGPHGVITQVREYFNTSLTVTRLGDGTKDSSLRSSPVWQSQMPNHSNKSLPGLVLAI
ncbi:hypothetical protein LUZ63_012082 [Rhynchospora breviuscula]|uniref:Wound-induced protein 1 n=1 Tax=Rhynchospora breviuscula TaxID=2022672 RepID=A0A9Q0HR52_9POAL|nr:hypothetical protein LUZ63_012082 [Rhynchospora breviuscula]